MGDFWTRLNERQKKWISRLAAAAVLGVALLALRPPSGEEPPVAPQAPAADDASFLSASAWERSLTELLNALLGTEHTQVFLSLERGSQLTIARNVTEEERQAGDGSREWRRTLTPVIMRNDGERKEEPLILATGEPLVRGVLVVVDRPFCPEIRLKTAKAVATALQVAAYRIEVLFKE